jgi:hypothetical protein
MAAAPEISDDELFEGFCSDVSRVMDDVMPWFRQVAENPKYDGTRGFRFMQIWPSGAAAHPRVIEVVRRYLVSAEAIIYAREVAEDETETDPDDETSWGVDDEESDAQFSTPYEMLFARLRSERPKLFEHFARFFFLPVGFDDHVLTSGESEGRG